MHGTLSSWHISRGTTAFLYHMFLGKDNVWWLVWFAMGVVCITATIIEVLLV